MKELPKPQYELLSAYLDGELSPSERAHVEQWLDGDSAARVRLDELRAVAAGLKTLPSYRLDEDLSDRVLRTAEHRILAEPTALAEAPRPAGPHERMTARRLARRFLTPRAIVWSGLAVAVAILLSVLPLEEPGTGRRLARRPDRRPAADAAPAMSPAFVAVEKPAETPAASEPSVAHEAGSAKWGESLKRAGSEGRAAARPDDAFGFYAGEATVPKDARGRLSAKKADGERLSARQRLAASENVSGRSEQRSAEVDAKPSAPADRSSGLAADGREAKPKGGDALGTLDADVNVGRTTSDRMLRKGPPLARGAVAESAVQRAMQNSNGLLVVNCGLTPQALEKKAFAEALSSNRIEPAAVSPGDQPLAGYLMANFAQPSSDGDENRRRWAAGRAYQAKDRPADAEKGMPVAAPSAGVGAAGESQQGQTATEHRWYDYSLHLAEGKDAEVVLVEGSPTQIVATLSALSRRKDVRVSIAPQQAVALRYLQTQLGEGLTQASSRESLGDELDFLRVDLGQSAEGEEGRQRQIEKAVGKAPQPKEAGAPLAQQEPFVQRGTAQRLGTIAMGEPAKKAGARVSPAETPAALGAYGPAGPIAPPQAAPSSQSAVAPAQQATPQFAPGLQAPLSPAYPSAAAPQQPPQAEGVLPTSPPPVRVMAEGERHAKATPLTVQGKGGLGMGGGMGGMGMGNQAPSQAGQTVAGTTPSRQTEPRPLGEDVRRQTTSGSSDRAKYGTAQTKVDAVEQRSQQPGGEQTARDQWGRQQRQPLLQVLFVLQRIPEQEPPVAAAASAPADAQVDGEAERQQQPSQEPPAPATEPD